MRELEVLGNGHLKLDWEERRAFFEEELEERVRSGVKQMLEQALETVAQLHRLLATSFNEDASRVSPDGHYLAYQSDETGRY